MMDNPSIETLRQSILTKEVEILTPRQTFQKKHPSVISAREQLDVLKNKLTSEVAADVNAQTMTLNPVQGELIKQKAIIEAEIIAKDVEVNALNQVHGNIDQEILMFSDNTANYVSLKRQATINQEVYLALRKQYEQYKVKEAEDSLDISIIDPADLPYKPSFQKNFSFWQQVLSSALFG